LVGKFKSGPNPVGGGKPVQIGTGDGILWGTGSEKRKKKGEIMRPTREKMGGGGGKGGERVGESVR